MAANRSEIKLTADMTNDPPVLAAEMAATESWIKAAVSAPRTASMRVYKRSPAATSLIKIPANRKAMYMTAAKENIPKYASAAAN